MRLLLLEIESFIWKEFHKSLLMGAISTKNKNADSLVGVASHSLHYKMLLLRMR